MGTALTDPMKKTRFQRCEGSPAETEPINTAFSPLRTMLINTAEIASDRKLACTAHPNRLCELQSLPFAPMPWLAMPEPDRLQKASFTRVSTRYNRQC